MNIFRMPFAVFPLIAIALFLTSAIFFSLNFSSLPDEIIIQFNNFEGVKTFGAKSDLMGILTITGIALVINFILAETLFYRDRILALMLLAASFFIGILNIIILLLIISIN